MKLDCLLFFRYNRIYPPESTCDFFGRIGELCERHCALDIGYMNDQRVKVSAFDRKCVNGIVRCCVRSKAVYSFGLEMRPNHLISIDRRPLKCFLVSVEQSFVPLAMNSGFRQPIFPYLSSDPSVSKTYPPAPRSIAIMPGRSIRLRWAISRINIRIPLRYKTEFQGAPNCLVMMNPLIH